MSFCDKNKVFGLGVFNNLHGNYFLNLIEALLEKVDDN